MHKFAIPLPGPCSFHHLLTRVSQSAHGAFYRVRDGRLGRPLWLLGQPYFVEVSATPNELLWSVQIHDGRPELEQVATSSLQHLFALDVDLSAFREHAGHDRVLLDLVERLSGARMIRDADLFVSVISSIISQQMNLAFAATLKRRLWSLSGQAMQVDGEVFYADPSPEAISRLDYAELRAMQFSQRKAEYVIDFARAVTDGSFSLQRLAELDDAAAISYLSSRRGLGQWTAECVLLFGLGRPDLLPAKDVGLQRAVARFYQMSERPSEQQVRQLGEAWHPWSSWYTYYLWLGLTL